jgi:hypothetical protein
LFRDDEVNEALPDDIVFLTSTPDEVAALPENEVENADTVDTVDNSLANDVGSDTGATDVVSDVEPETVTLPDDVDMPDQVTAVETHRLTFRDADSFHQGSGTAIIYALSNGEHLLRFENFSVTNGPDLKVYLVPRANRGDVSIDGYVDLGSLKGNVGDQNYTIPAGVDVPEEVSVVIWCEPFRVLFSVAAVE